ncbi:tripartite tricarboxylate transporter TctB family protein [Rhabdaerophilum calidifontis]|uniref:tripartite tricarboxylate transporter TctB family protein n=1 Tax=Rhabdaerophilum calidifontis TaxID=2604328 RepID=UPI00123BF9FD|nr:tripartite tricarboxylate transporter TctB family protein [Rhabdaerophilum calidifontis]
MTDTSRNARLSGRIAALALLAFALVYGLFGARIEYAFASDPIGPRGFPVALALVLALLALWYLARPGEAEEWPGRAGLGAALAFLGTSVACLLVFDHAGFVPSMAVLMAVIARLFGAGWITAILGGIGQALLWWLLFGPLLGGNLPKGLLGF